MTITSAPFIVDRQHIRIGYWLAALVAIVGLVVGIASGIAGTLTALSAPDQFDRTSGGGSLTVEVKVSGPMVVYSEASVAPSLGKLDLTVVDPSGTQVAVNPYVGDLQYDRNGGLGTAVGTFTASETGRYHISSGAAQTAGIIAVGPDIGGGLADAIVRAGMIIGLAFAAGIALAAASSMMARR